MTEDKKRAPSEKIPHHSSSIHDEPPSFELTLEDSPVMLEQSQALDDLEFDPVSQRETLKAQPLLNDKSVEAPSLPVINSDLPVEPANLIPDLSPMPVNKGVTPAAHFELDAEVQASDAVAPDQAESLALMSPSASEIAAGQKPKRGSSGAPPIADARDAHIDLDTALGGFDTGFDLQAVTSGLESGGPEPAGGLDLSSPSLEKEVRWPHLLSPEANVDQLDAELILQHSGYGPAPEQVWLTPLYSLTVFLANRALPERVRGAQQVVNELLLRRASCLGAVAELHRQSLAEKPRFSPLYEAQAKQQQSLESQLSALELLDKASSELMAALEVRVNTARERLSTAQKEASFAAGELSQHNEEVSRLDAQRTRMAIERRNRMGALDDSADLPVELAKQYNDQDRQLTQAAGQSRQKVMRSSRQYEQLLDTARVAMAELQTVLAEKAALDFAHAGELSLQLKQVDSARESYRDAAAATGAALVQLRGEVAVSNEVREELLSLEEQLDEEALKVALLEHASKACDHEAYRKGLYLGGGFVGVFLLSLVWAIFR